MGAVQIVFGQIQSAKLLDHFWRKELRWKFLETVLTERKYSQLLRVFEFLSRRCKCEVRKHK